MVVHNLYIDGITITPKKTDSILIIDTYAALSFSITFQYFQPVARGNSKIFQSICVIQHLELTGGCFLNVTRQSPRVMSVEKSFGLLTLKALDHIANNNVIR